jgi:oligopeptide/dipeptide ABC transporter ATP-binding protein
VSDNGATPILRVQDVKKHFAVTEGVLWTKTVGWVKAVDGISFTVPSGQTLAIVGESGCGKTTTAKLILRLESPTAGHVFVDGKDVHALSGDELKDYRTTVQAVFQDPWSSLSPRMRVREIVAEPLVVNRKMSSQEVKHRVDEIMASVGLRPQQANLYPHEFSGGQRQRIAVASALVSSPKLIVLDEPVSALDVSIRAQIMNLLVDLQRQYGVSYLLIAHHLATTRYMAHEVAVMYLGKIVERAKTKELFGNPLHPYTKALFSAALPGHPDVTREEIILSGEVPSPINPPSGCHFHPRCPFAMPQCATVEPEDKAVATDHTVACHLY